MANIFKKAFKGRRLVPTNNNEPQRPRSPLPPPSPDLTGLSSDELAALNDVIKRQEEFENKEKNRIAQIKEQLREYECKVKRQSSTKGKLKHIDLRLCRLCYKTKFADGIGRVCYDCRKRVCQRCGLYVRDQYSLKSSKRGRGRWQCNMCQLKRELLCKTGEWYHGHKAQPSLNKQAFHEKLDTIDLDSSDIEDFATKQPCTSPSQSASEETATDTEVVCNRVMQKDVNQQKPRRRSMFASAVVDISENESDNDGHYERRTRKNSRRHTSRLDVKKKRHKVYRRPNSDSNSDNQSDNDTDYISENYLHVPRDLKNGRTRKSAESRRFTENNNERIRRKTDECIYGLKGVPSNYSNVVSLGVDDIEQRSRRSSAESVLSVNQGGVSVYFQPYDSLSEDQTSSRRSTSSSIIKRQEAICYSSSSSIISDNIQSNRRHSVSPSPSNGRRYSSASRDISRTSSLDHQDYSASEQRNQLQVLTVERGSRRCSDESIRSRKSSQSDASQYYKDYFNNLKPREVLLYRDSIPYSPRYHGLGMRVIGGKRGPDGGLGAYVTYVEKKGPADSYDIVEGDQILFWNGKSLIDISFEESREIMCQSTDFVQLLVVHFPERKEEVHKKTTSNVTRPNWTTENNERASSVDIPVVVSSGAPPNHSSIYEPPRSLPLNKPKRRMLPKTPLEIKKEDRPVTGKVHFSLGYNENDECLSVNLVKAETLKPPDRLSVSDLNPIAMVHILPDRSSFPPYETIPQFNVTSPVWDETFNLLDLSKSELEEKSLEVTIWSYVGHDYEFLGEVLLDLADVKLNNEVIAYDLQDHDENSSPLPVRRRRESGSDITSTSFISPVETSSMASSPCNYGSTQSRDTFNNIENNKSEARRTPKRKSSPAFEKLHRVYQSVPSSPTLSPDTNRDLSFYEQIPHRGSISSKMKRRVSSAMAKISHFSHTDRREADKESLANRSKSAGDVISQITNTPSPKHSIQNPLASCATNISSFFDTENDKEELARERLASVDRPPPEGDDITSSLGSSQIPPRPSSEQLVCGNIRLGFMVSKGQLEIDVINASGLQNGTDAPPPDTYVKTYLVEGPKIIQKKKTNVVKSSCEPMYRKKIKYSACNIHGRNIKVIVWARQKTFDKKISLGEAIIKLDGMNLSEHCVSWYKLFQTGAADYGSNESLSFWNM